ncbi:hypothetical protein B0T09DRAFT_28239 [Sordaria sp. MPI-SDFR-AT-0083]|nr:hypothetical protein B0T09DRAFT_28239 [Sordaria sp. MPI-SDFR-AT-0083]
MIRSVPLPNPLTLMMSLKLVSTTLVTGQASVRDWAQRVGISRLVVVLGGSGGCSSRSGGSGAGLGLLITGVAASAITSAATTVLLSRLLSVLAALGTIVDGIDTATSDVAGLTAMAALAVTLTLVKDLLVNDAGKADSVEVHLVATVAAAITGVTVGVCFVKVTG